MLTICTDLFLTEAFLIKGTVEGKYTRLSKLMDGHERTFLKVRDATLIDLNSRDRIKTPLLHMNMDQVLLAHEYLDEAGDGTRAELAREQVEDLQKVRVFYTGGLNIELCGDIRPQAYEVTDSATQRYFVMRNPDLRGFKHHGDEELKALLKLPYVILNKERLSYVYDFN